jgi:hypothetical protein
MPPRHIHKNTPSLPPTLKSSFHYHRGDQPVLKLLTDPGLEGF